MRKSLRQIWNELPLKSDKGDLHSYVEVYEEILSPYRETAKNILEIGLFNGASLLLWEQYFSGNVYGIDCSDQPHGGMADLRPLINEGGHNILIFDAESHDDVLLHFAGMKFDIIIEDCQHNIPQQLKLYEVFKPYLNKGALYIIEDIENLDESRLLFEHIDDEKKVIIIDNRELKKRYDDCLVIITDKND